MAEIYENFTNQSTWTPFNGGSYSINNGELFYDNSSTTQGTLYSPYELGLDPKISFNIRLVTDYANRQHGGCWLYDKNKNNWFRLSFLDTSINTTEVRNGNPGNVPAWLLDNNTKAIIPFNSKNTYEFRLEIQDKKVTSYVNDSLVDERILIFNPYGFALFSYGSKIAIDNLKISNFELSSLPVLPQINETKWWNIVPNSGCIFALDSDSIIEYKNNVVRYSNDPNKFLYTENYSPNKVSKTIASGYTTKNFIPDLKKILSYKSIYINNSNLIFQDPLVIPDNFTMVLKVKVKNTSEFLSNTLINRKSHGLTLDYTNGSYPYLYNWRIINLNTGDSYSTETRSTIFKTISTVIMKGNKADKNVDIITEYGIYTVPSSNVFLTTNPYNILGTPSYGYYPDADIIAYGLFDKVFSMEEVQVLLSQIDKDFLMRSVPITPLNLRDTSFTKYVLSSSIDIARAYLKTVPYIQYTKLNNGSNVTKTNNYGFFENITKYKTISDYIFKEGVPISTLVFLYERKGGVLVAKSYSDEKGYFEFKDVNADLEYVVTSNDTTYQFKSVIKNYDK